MPPRLSTHQKILEILKKNHNSTMDSIAKDLGISKMAVLKHLFRMEKDGIIERKSIKKNVGRPVSVFSLTEQGEERFRSSYSDTIKSLISFLVDHGHRDLAVQFLKERYAFMQTEYAKSLSGLTYEKRLEKLSEMRDSAGYMAELKGMPSGMHELVEFNCPIFQVASVLEEACSLESMMFKNVLDSDIQTTHRVVEGRGYCRFLINKRRE